jgi:hypothetical protein
MRLSFVFHLDGSVADWGNGLNQHYRRSILPAVR